MPHILQSMAGRGSRETFSAGAPLTITYYTDPLCSWSWAFEAPWRRLRHDFAGHIAWRYCMGGLISDWQHYADPLNDVSRPAQMGPHWFQVKALSGMPIIERIWYEDPPASSYPACLAVKAAEQQGAAQGETLLRRLREAVMLEARNIARRETLLEIASALGEEQEDFDAGRFACDLDATSTADALRRDLQETRTREIGRFPTLVLRHGRGSSAQAVLLTGYRPYPALRDVLARLAPDLLPGAPPASVPVYLQQWRRVTAREIAEAFDLEPAAARSELDSLTAAGILVRRGDLYACAP